MENVVMKNQGFADFNLWVIRYICRLLKVMKDLRSKAPLIEAPPGTCGSKRTCKDMSSCDEAKFYLTQCGLSRLDRDGDGIPCEKLCRGH